MNLLRTKSPDLLIRESEAPERKMKRALTAFDLTCLGIGAIIGAGIFALAGTAAAGESAHVGESIVKTPIINFIIAFLHHSDLVFGRPAAGPAVALSFVVAALACAFAALCYSELAAMIPVSGSAYTYSYATLGELIAWIIGWDLILEYAVGNMAVAKGWSDYFVKFLYSRKSRGDKTSTLARIRSDYRGDQNLPGRRECAVLFAANFAPSLRISRRYRSSGVADCRGGDGAFDLWNSRERDHKHDHCPDQARRCRVRDRVRRVHG